MAAGDLLLLGEQGNGDLISDTPVALTWDTALAQDPAYTPVLGGGVVINEPGRYLVIPSMSAEVLSGPGRLAVQTYLEKTVSGGTPEELPYGYTYSYIRGAGGAFEGRDMSSFVDVFGAGDELKMLAVRRDSQDATTVQRIEGSSLMMLRIADRWPLLRGKFSSQTSALGTTWETVGWDTAVTNEPEGFAWSPAGANPENITLNEGEHYLAMVCLRVSNTFSDRTVTEMRWTLGGAQLEGLQPTCYSRGTSDLEDGYNQLWGVKLFQVPTGGGALDFNVEVQRSDQGPATTLLPDGSWIHIIRMPDAGEYARMREAGGGQRFDTAAVLETDTDDEMDSPLSRSGFGIDSSANPDRTLIIGNLHGDRGLTPTTQLMQPFMRFAKNGAAVRFAHNAAYSRGTDPQGDVHSSFGLSAIGIFPQTTAETIQVDIAMDAGLSGDSNATIAADGATIEAISLTNLFATLSDLSYSPASIDGEVNDSVTLTPTITGTPVSWEEPESPWRAFRAPEPATVFASNALIEVRDPSFNDSGLYEVELLAGHPYRNINPLTGGSTYVDPNDGSTQPFVGIISDATIGGRYGFGSVNALADAVHYSAPFFTGLATGAEVIVRVRGRIVGGLLSIGGGGGSQRSFETHWTTDGNPTSTGTNKIPVDGLVIMGARAGRVDTIQTVYFRETYGGNGGVTGVQKIHFENLTWENSIGETRVVGGFGGESLGRIIVRDVFTQGNPDVALTAPFSFGGWWVKWICRCQAGASWTLINVQTSGAQEHFWYIDRVNGGWLSQGPSTGEVTDSYFVDCSLISELGGQLGGCGRTLFQIVDRPAEYTADASHHGCRGNVLFERCLDLDRDGTEWETVTDGGGTPIGVSQQNSSGSAGWTITHLEGTVVLRDCVTDGGPSSAITGTTQRSVICHVDPANVNNNDNGVRINAGGFSCEHLVLINHKSPSTLSANSHIAVSGLQRLDIYEDFDFATNITGRFDIEIDQNREQPINPGNQYDLAGNVVAGNITNNVQAGQPFFPTTGAVNIYIADLGNYSGWNGASSRVRIFGQTGNTTDLSTVVATLFEKTIAGIPPSASLSSSTGVISGTLSAIYSPDTIGIRAVGISSDAYALIPATVVADTGATGTVDVTGLTAGSATLGSITVNQGTPPTGVTVNVTALTASAASLGVTVTTPSQVNLELGFNVNECYGGVTQCLFKDMFLQTQDWQQEGSGPASRPLIVYGPNGFPDGSNAVPSIAGLTVHDFPVGSFEGGTYTILWEAYDAPTGGNRDDSLADVRLVTNTDPGGGAGRAILEQSPGRIAQDVDNTVNNEDILVRLVVQPGARVENIRVYVPGADPVSDPDPTSILYGVARQKLLEATTSGGPIRFLNFGQERRLGAGAVGGGALTTDGWQITPTWPHKYPPKWWPGPYGSGDPNLWEPHQASSQRAEINPSLLARSGVAVELQVKICNELGRPMWYCMPYEASETYQRGVLRYIRDNLNGLLYLEWSNETWNSQFPVYSWLNGQTASGSQGERDALAGQLNELMNVVAVDVFQNEPAVSMRDKLRLVVLGSPNASVLVNKLAEIASPIDGAGTVGYLKPTDELAWNTGALPAPTTTDEVIDSYLASIPRLTSDMTAAANEVAAHRARPQQAGRELEYVVYECGQSVLAATFWQGVMAATQVDPRMEEVYQAMYDVYVNVGVSLTCWLAFSEDQELGGNSSAFGTQRHMHHESGSGTFPKWDKVVELASGTGSGDDVRPPSLNAAQAVLGVTVSVGRTIAPTYTAPGAQLGVSVFVGAGGDDVLVNVLQTPQAVLGVTVAPHTEISVTGLTAGAADVGTGLLVSATTRVVLDGYTAPQAILGDIALVQPLQVTVDGVTASAAVLSVASNIEVPVTVTLVALTVPQATLALERVVQGIRVELPSLTAGAAVLGGINIAGARESVTADQDVAAFSAEEMGVIQL